MSITATIGTSYDLHNGFVWPDGALTVSIRPLVWEIGGVRGSQGLLAGQAVLNGTNYIYIDSAGALQIANPGPYPAVGPYVALARVTAAAGVITGITDDRAFLCSSGIAVNAEFVLLIINNL